MGTVESATIEHRITVLTLQSITTRIRFLTRQLAELDPELFRLLRQHPAGPALLAQPGVGPVVAAQLLLSWSHPGRVRNEAAFASLAGVAPLEASSGQRTRHRLNRGGDRALNRALHTVAITKMRCHPETRAYEIKRTAEGKTHRDIRRCLKRTLARKLYRGNGSCHPHQHPPPRQRLSPLDCHNDCASVATATRIRPVVFSDQI
ncbi:transposase [Rhodococcus opacus]|uniref:transposase n=1 Tax=Rhodococcus opacus TaxID=37919 RepID=UPI0018C8B0F1|nr:transposase [Rhodococcus opacus]